MSYAKKINKNEGKIDWNNPAEKILFQINALNPKPGAWFLFQNIRFKILSAEIKEISGKVGEVIDDELTHHVAHHLLSHSLNRAERRHEEKTPNLSVARQNSRRPRTQRPPKCHHILLRKPNFINKEVINDQRILLNLLRIGLPWVNPIPRILH